MYNILINIKQKVQTIYDLSDIYSITKERPLFRSGQGSRGSPKFWAVIAYVLFDSIDEKGKELEVTKPMGYFRSATKKTSMWIILRCEPMEGMGK